MGLQVAAVFGLAGCRHAPPSPARWGDAHASPDVAFIVGEVRSSSRGRPLEAARVRLLGPDGAARDSVSTDAAGAFVLGPIPPGDYRVRVRALLHREVTRSLVLRPGVVDTVRLRLTYDDTGVIWDCVGPQQPDGSRGFGSQFCRP